MPLRTTSDTDSRTLPIFCLEALRPAPAAHVCISRAVQPKKGSPGHMQRHRRTTLQNACHVVPLHDTTLALQDTSLDSGCSAAGQCYARLCRHSDKTGGAAWRSGCVKQRERLQSTCESLDGEAALHPAHLVPHIHCSEGSPSVVGWTETVVLGVKRAHVHANARGKKIRAAVSRCRQRNPISKAVCGAGESHASRWGGVRTAHPSIP